MTTKTTISTVLLLVLLFAVQSCKQFTIADANKLQRGMPPNEVLDLASKGPADTYTNTVLKAEVQVYKIAIGEYQSDYFVAFKEGKLFYWGYPYEFMRHHEPSVVEIAKWTVEQRNK